MRHYPEYKESGVEWIGETPGHWETKAVWMMFRLGRGRVISNEEMGAHPGQYPVYSSQTEDEGVMGYIDTYDFDGDYITWTTDGAKAGTVFYRTGQFNCTNVCGTLLPRNQNLDLRFFHHALNIVTSRFVRYDINPKLMNNVMAKIRVQVPPVAEQRAIANFLNRKTEQIDELIRIKGRRIELLQEQRTALINQTVTKGLDPNVEMKPSGVEWIGEIPKHWTITRLKYLGESIIGLSYKPEDVTDDKNGTLVLRASNIQNGKPSFLDNVYVNAEVDEKLYLKEDDILICSRSGSRELIGKNITITKELEGITFGVFMTIFRTKFFRFISYFLNSQVFKNQSGLFLTSTINQLTINTLNNFLISFPTDEREQAQIADFLDHKTQQIDELIAAEQRKIELLKEYRQSLISEAVTGKIDVRNEV